MWLKGSNGRLRSGDQSMGGDSEPPAGSWAGKGDQENDASGIHSRSSREERKGQISGRMRVSTCVWVCGLHSCVG